MLILPYIEEQALYDSYNFSEPWDSPSNLRLIDRMPSIFQSPSEPSSTRHTNFVAITGPGTAFPGSDSTALTDFLDGAANTLLLTEISNSEVPWLQPRDIDTSKGEAQLNGPGPLCISSADWRQPFVIFADNLYAYSVSDDMPPEALRALTTLAGREPCSRSELIQKGYLECSPDAKRHSGLSP